MMIITDAIQDLQLLSNIGDLAVSGKAVSGTAVDHSSVTVKIGETEILDETLYSDDDGTVWIRDVKTLLKPYIEPASISSFTIKVGSTTYTLNVMYCLAKIENLSADSNVATLRGNFPTTAAKKKISMDTQELLPLFGNYSYAKQQNLQLKVLCSIDGGSPEEKTITIVASFTAGQIISYVDVSPTRVRGFLATQLSVSADKIRIYGYTVGFEYFDYSPQFVYSVTSAGLPLTLCYQNAFGAWETQPVVGSQVVTRDYAVTNAKISGKLKRIDSRLTKAHAFSIPLVTDVDNEILEAIIASQSLKMYEDGQWHEITITNYTHETDGQFGVQNSISFTYEWQESDHRVQRQKTMPTGSGTAFGGYVADGLIFQLDCEYGQKSTKWTSCELKGIDSKTLTGTFSNAEDGAVVLSSAVSLGEILGLDPAKYTIEACILPVAKNTGNIVESDGQLLSADASYIYAKNSKYSNTMVANEGVTLATIPGDVISGTRIALLYVNGVSASTGSSSDKVGTTNFTIGAGSVYSIRVYNRSLTSSEIASNNQIDENRFRIPANAFIMGNGEPFILGNGGFFLLGGQS